MSRLWEGKGLPRPLVLSAALGVFLTLPVTASATTRYAAPGGTATAAQCTTPATPCTINEAATGTGVVAADEVVIAPGDYSDTAGDLGVDGFVTPIAGNVHGTAGSPRPTITKNNSSAFGAINVSTGITVSYLSIQSTVSDRGIFVNGGTVDRVIARATGSFGATCAQIRGLIRNTACIATSTSGVAVGTSVGTSGALTPSLRGVTAISLGASGFGLDYRVGGGGSLAVSVKSVIADGGSADVRTGRNDGSASASVITIDHSNFNTQTTLAGGTITDGGNNQTSAPLLGADKVHQLAGSPTVEAGAVDGTSGTADVDGQNRTLGGAPDIGADERGNPTTTSVGCSPSSVQAGSSSTCTLTVTDTAVTGATTPTGNVGLSSDTTGGTFGSGGVCTLVLVNSTQASCQITYTPGQVGSGSHGLTGEYLADTTHEPSQGTTSLGVTAHPISTTVDCAPVSVPYGSPTTCTATVADTATTGKTTPTGDVSLESDTSGGAFESGGTCTLAMVNSSSASCHLDYTPGQVGDGSHQITASYEGDSTHSDDQGSTDVTVTSHGTMTGVTCTPDSLTLGVGSSSCVVTVSDTASAGSTTATGSVDLATTGTGTFDAGCATLTSGSCTATYTPGAVGTHQVTASYGGDQDHDGSQGTDAVSVSAPVVPVTPVPVTPVTPTANPLCATLRKKLKKAKKAHNQPKVRKLKRKLRKLGC